MAAPAERALPEKASAKGAFAHELFFPGAFALALIAVPVWLLAHLGLLDRPELTSPAWHAHEMLFGYTLAVVAGFLLARLSRPWLALLFGAWLAGRAAMLLGLDGPIAVMLALLFPLLLAAQTAPAFLRAARKGTNQAFAPILIGFIAAALLVQAGDLGLLAEGRRHGLLLALDLVTLLLLMGGRIIPAATAGVFYRRSEELKARVQPVLERTVLAAAGADAGARPGAGGGLGRRCRGAGRRRGNRPAARPLADPRACRPSRSVGLHLGYAWLALALILKGAALLATSPHLVGLHHALAIGALGTMTLVMMLRTAASRGQRTRAVPGAVGLVALALSLATLARLAAPLLHGVAHVLGLGLAAGLWAIGVLICAALYLAVRAPRARETPPAHSFFHRAANPATMAPARSEAGGAMRETFHSPSTAAPPTARACRGALQLRISI